MVQLAQMTGTINTMQAQLKSLAAAPLNQTRSKSNTNVGVEGVNILTGVKPDAPRNLAIRMRPTTIRDRAEARKGANGV